MHVLSLSDQHVITNNQDVYNANYVAGERMSYPVGYKNVNSMQMRHQHLWNERIDLYKLYKFVQICIRLFTSWTFDFCGSGWTIQSPDGKSFFPNNFILILIYIIIVSFLCYVWYFIQVLNCLNLMSENSSSHLYLRRSCRKNLKNRSHVW